MDRRKFLRLLGLGAAATALNPVQSVARALTTSSSLRLDTINGTNYLTIPPAQGATPESIARIYLGDERLANYVRTWNEKRPPASYATEVRWDKVTPELQAALNEERYPAQVEDDGITLLEFLEEAADVSHYGPERTLHLIQALNNIAEENAVLNAGMEIEIPNSIRNVEYDPPRDPFVLEQSRFRNKSAPPRKTTRSDDQLIADMAQYKPPIPATAENVARNIKKRDKFGAPRAGGRKHQGVDIWCPLKTPLLPISIGRIVEIDSTPSRRRNGNTIAYVTPAGSVFKYIHLASFRSNLKIGDIVDHDTIIGYCGITGNARFTPRNPHVHVQLFMPIRGKMRLADPMPFILGQQNSILRARLQSSEREKYLEWFREADRNAF